MACPGSPCSPPPASAGTWTFTAIPAANRFCDARLIGLAASDASQGTTLTAIDPITGCLTRPAGPKGVWQHDPDGCLPDFFGPLDNPAFCGLLPADPTKAHYLPVLESTCGGTDATLVKQTALSGNQGLPAMLRAECCEGATSWSVMAPELLINGRQSAAGSCVSPRVLAFTSYERVVCPGTTVTEYTWYAMDSWQQAGVAAVVEADIFDAEEEETANLTFAAWRTETCPGGGSVNQLVSMGPAQLDRILGLNRQAGAIDFTDTPELIYSQYKVNAIGTFPPHFPAAPPAGTGSFLTQAVSVDMTTKTGYSTNAKGVLLNFVLKAYTDEASSFDIVLAANGMEYARVALPGEFRGGTDTNQVMVPLLPDGTIDINCYMQVTSGDAVSGFGLALVYLQGFTY